MACAQNDFTVPRWKEARWIDHEERMKLTFCSAADAEYARKWVQTSEDLAAKYAVEEKKARIPMMMNVEKIRLAFRDPEKVKDFFDLEAKFIPGDSFTADDFRPGELVRHERGWNLRLSLSPALVSYAKKTAKDLGSAH